jgi:hypothetical protein
MSKFPFAVHEYYIFNNFLKTERFLYSLFATKSTLDETGENIQSATLDFSVILNKGQFNQVKSYSALEDLSKTLSGFKIHSPQLDLWRKTQKHDFSAI